MSKFVYPVPRPDLVVESGGGRKLGNCYHAHDYLVTSRRQLSAEKLKGLRDLGFLGYGQSFIIHSQCDGDEQPAGFDEVECVEIDRMGNEVPGPAINPYSGKPYGTTKYHYYEYRIERRVDSSD